MAAQGRSFFLDECTAMSLQLKPSNLLQPPSLSPEKRGALFTANKGLNTYTREIKVLRSTRHTPVVFKVLNNLALRCGRFLFRANIDLNHQDLLL